MIVASNPAVSVMRAADRLPAWRERLTHPHLTFDRARVRGPCGEPDGGALRADAYSDPRDESGYSAEDLISLGFVNSPAHLNLVDDSKPLAAVRADDYDAALLVGGQGPMYTFFHDDRVYELVGSFYEAGKVTAVICHATCVLLKARLADGRLLVEGITWTGFATPRSATPTTSPG